ncbi:DUF3823 domain-containing protein [Mucilaginibacter calamicampi]|uniref:DUF3823 domain-containing protein n=1 Tax=Mucilaginibacter calamicampi TaxID=1302352 RepID=A0ABW2Z293_9SPHI
MKKNYRITLVITLLAAAGFLLQSCGKDNLVSYPTSIIKGAITYNGQPVRLMSSNNQLNSGVATQNLNTLVLRQTGPQPLQGGDNRIFARNDGTFTVNTFDGDYELRPNPSRAPFQDFTPIPFTLNGEQTINIPVTPYFWVSNFQSTFVDSVFTATFKLDRIVSTAALQEVRVYFNTTNKVDASAQVFSRQFTTVAQGVNINGNCTITVNLKGSGMTLAEKLSVKATTKRLWANVAVKTSNIVDALYQQNIELK